MPCGPRVVALGRASARRGEPPWAEWALLVAPVPGLEEAARRYAAALLLSDGGARGGDRLAGLALLAESTGAGAGGAGNGALVEHALRATAEGELAAAWPARVLLLLAGADPSAAGDWHRAVALLAALRAWSGVGRVERPESASGDALVDLLVKETEPGDPLIRALAGRLDTVRRELEVQAVLGSAPVRPRVRREWEATGVRLRASVPEGSGLLGLLSAMQDHFDHLESVLRFRALAALVPGAATRWTVEQTDRDLAAARDHVGEEPRFVRSWEFQRWGITDTGEPVYGRWFVRGLVLLALDEAGFPRLEELEALLAGIPPGGLRWYGAWKGIPPDADSLGLMLQVAARLRNADLRGEREGDPETLRDREERVSSWLSWMEASLLPGETLPVWFTTPPPGREQETVDWTFPGDDCTAVRLMCLQGLLAWGPGRHRRLLERNTTRILEGFEGDTGGAAFYYRPPWTRGQLLRFARAYLGRGGAQAMRMRKVVARVVRAVRAEQRLDGGWGSPLATAGHLEVLAFHGGPRMALWRGLRYLSETQRPDGSWPLEDLYLMPGKTPDRVAWYRGTELGTALCMRAMAQVRRALGRQKEAP